MVEDEDGGRFDGVEDLPPADLGLDLEMQQRGEAEALHDFPGGPSGRRPAPGGREVGCGLPLALHRRREQRPAGPPPSPGDLLEVLAESHIPAAYFTSAISSGGTFMAVIRGECPTVSDAISSASPRVPALRKPRRATVLRSPPT